MKDLIIICAGDFGREVANVVERINSVADEPVWNLAGFVDDDLSLQGKEIDGYPVLGTVDDLNSGDMRDDCRVICSVGTAKDRKKILERITNPSVQYATLIYPDARIYRCATVGKGSVICGGSILAIGVRVGDHVIVNLTVRWGTTAATATTV